MSVPAYRRKPLAAPLKAGLLAASLFTDTMMLLSNEKAIPRRYRWCVTASIMDEVRQVLFGGFIAPVNNPWFDRQLFDEWLLSENFAARKNILLRAVRDGDAETFFAIAAEMHEVTRQIVEAFGGKEDRPA